MSEANKQIVLRLIDEFQVRGDTSVADELLSSEFIDHGDTPSLTGDRETTKEHFAVLRTALEGFTIDIHDVIAEGDRVMTRKTLRGRQTGSLLGAPPTGNEVAFDVMDVFRLDDGQIVERWSVVDRVSLLEQLGVSR